MYKMQSVNRKPQQEARRPSAAVGAFIKALNGPWHKRALQVFIIIVVAHWVEHLLQAFQNFVLGWPREHSLGALGSLFPWLVSSEWLHYWYAFVMLVGLIVLRPAFVGRARIWWTVALAVQIWHHFEHALLLAQATVNENLFGSPVPTSILQLVIPRVELHLFYNAVVFVPMLVAVYFHLYPPVREVQASACGCSHRRTAVSTSP